MTAHLSAVCFTPASGLTSEAIAHIHKIARRSFAPGAYYNVYFGLGGGSLGAEVTDDQRLAWFQTPVENE